jgi:hypothetical protein
MKTATHNIFGISKQRGIWLRCFLESGSILAIALTVVVRSAGAQITVLKPLHLSQVTGCVTDKSGKPVSAAEITLDREGQIALKTETDLFGKFRIDGGEGRYWLHVKLAKYATAGRDVIIGGDLWTLFHRTTLYVILDPVGCMDDCSPVLTSKKRFDHAVRWNTGHYD